MVTLQHLIYPKPGICTEEPMFFRHNETSHYAWSDDFITFDRWGFAEFDTYFNSVTAEKLFKYTSVTKIYVNLRLNGCFRVTLLRKEKCGPEILTDVISETDVSSDGQTNDFLFAFDCSKTFGIYCFRIVSLKKGSIFYGGEYLADVPENKIRDIKIGIDICTYKREKFIEKNIEHLTSAFLANESSSLHGRLELFISDNAHTLPDDLNTEYVHIFKNKNVGGAGGFTRGLIEIIRDGNPKGITHALLLDDDIVLEPETIFKTYALLSILKEEYRDAFVGGAMLRLDRPYIQVESGALWNGGDVISLKCGLDLRGLEPCLYNETAETADYNAWWYSVVPIENVREDNLPMPIFIRGDDAEYGLRNTRKLILMNGICVWHEPFENKYSSSMFYYILRNRLIDNAVRRLNFPIKRFLKEFKDWVYNEIFCLKYKNAELLLRGVEDFFRGVDWFKAQDGEALNQQVMADSYKLKYVDELEIPFSYPKYEQDLAIPQDKGFKGFIKKIIIKLTNHGLYLPAKKTKIVPADGVRPRQMIGVCKALNYDRGSQRGFVTQKDTKQAGKLLSRYRKVRKLIKSKYYKMSEQYASRADELTSIDFWNNYLDIGD